MKHYIYLSLIITLGLLTGCSDEILITDPTTPTISGDYYFVLSGMSSQTRAIDYQSDTHSVFSEGDVLGAFAITAAGGSALYTDLGTNEANNNVQYKVKNVTGGQVLVPVDETKQLPKGATYIFYYPYNKDFTSISENKIQYSNDTGVRYSIQTNQNSVDNDAEHHSTNYENSDLLWDVVSASDEDNRVHVEMDHVMANIIFKIPSNLIKEGSDVKILNRQTTGYQIFLYKSGRDGDGNLTDDWGYNVLNQYSGGALSDITMWKYDTDEDGVSTYRAVVLACNGDDGAFIAYKDI